MKFTAATVAAIAALSSTVEAKTHRQAFAGVWNDMPDPILSVSLMHKYSDVYKNNQEYAVIQPGRLSPDSLTVDYNTGIETTGKDWWMVSWYTSDLKTFCYTDPNNFRGLFDAFDHVAPGLITAVVAVAAAVITEGDIDSAQKAGQLAWATTNELFNTEATKGFKQHILTGADSKNWVDIHLKTGGNVEIRSRSGVSTTKYTCRSTNI